MNEPDFWNNPEEANMYNKELTLLKKETSSYNNIQKSINDDIEILELLKLDENLSLKEELENDINQLTSEIDELEINTLLNGEYDNNDCYLEIHPEQEVLNLAIGPTCYFVCMNVFVINLTINTK